MLLSPLATLDLDDLDRMHRINIRGTFVVAQQAAQPGAPGRRDHQLLLVGDEARGSRPTPRTPPARPPSRPSPLILARELRGRDITVNAVAPGPTATAAVPRRQGPGARSTTSPRRPRWSGWARPDDIAEVVSFLAGPARWVNGQTIYANGGII